MVQPGGRLGLVEEPAAQLRVQQRLGPRHLQGHLATQAGVGGQEDDAVAAPAGTSTYAAAAVHFTPGARTAWHTHPHGQTIFVTEGVGRCQREGGPVEELRPGDRVFFAAGENHWHGGAPNRFMAHVAIQQTDESGSAVSWGRHVEDDEYAPS